MAYSEDELKRLTNENNNLSWKSGFALHMGRTSQFFDCKTVKPTSNLGIFFIADLLSGSVRGRLLVPALVLPLPYQWLYFSIVYFTNRIEPGTLRRLTKNDTRQRLGENFEQCYVKNSELHWSSRSAESSWTVSIWIIEVQIGGLPKVLEFCASPSMPSVMLQTCYLNQRWQ